MQYYCNCHKLHEQRAVQPYGPNGDGSHTQTVQQPLDSSSRAECALDEGKAKARSARSGRVVRRLVRVSDGQLNLTMSRFGIGTAEQGVGSQHPTIRIMPFPSHVTGPWQAKSA
jgi:hypothetical protein